MASRSTPPPAKFELFVSQLAGDSHDWHEGGTCFELAEAVPAKHMDGYTAAQTLRAKLMGRGVAGRVQRGGRDIRPRVG